MGREWRKAINIYAKLLQQTFRTQSISDTLAFTSTATSNILALFFGKDGGGWRGGGGGEG